MNPITEERKETEKKKIKPKSIQERFAIETNKQANYFSNANKELYDTFISSINHYSINQGYKEINPILRMTKSDNLSEIKSEAEEIAKTNPFATRDWNIPRAIETIKILDESFKNFKTIEDVTVYRRAGAGALGFPPSDKGNPINNALVNFNQPENKEWLLKNVIEKYQKKKIFLDRGYLSTSFEEKYRHSSFENNPIHLEIFVPKATRAITITGIFESYKNEKELLLDRGYSIEIKDIKIAIIEGQRKILIKGDIILNNDR